MNEPSTWTPADRNDRNRVTSASPASLNRLCTAFRPSAVTDSTPTRAPRIFAQRNEAKPFPPKGHDLGDDGGDGSLARLLTVGPPHRAERAVLRAAAYGLHR